MKYEENIIAFIDILGFKELLNTGKVQTIFNILKSFHENAQDAHLSTVDGLKLLDYQILKEKGEDPQRVEIEYKTIKNHIFLYSDSIYFFYPITVFKEELFYKLHSIINSLQFFYTKMIENGIAIRGGITLKKAFIHPPYYFGKELLEIPLLEKKAKVPRIIIDNYLLNDERFAPILNISSIERDEDGIFFISIFDYIKFWSNIKDQSEGNRALSIKIMSFFKTTIANGLKNDKVDVIEKYNWLARKYQETFKIIEKSDIFNSEEIHSLRLNENDI